MSTVNIAPQGTVNATAMPTDNDIAIMRHDVAERIKKHQERIKELNLQRIGLCPRLTNEERAQILEFEEDVEVDHADAVIVQDLRKNRSFSDEDKDQIAAAKLAHRRLINTPEMKAEACEMLAKSYLSAFKLTHKKDGRIGVSVRGQI